MKIACEGCGARYSVSDEVVAGRAVRARCKRCGGAITLTGPARAAPAPSDSQPAPTGARNESSILFSPSQLGMLAPAPSRAAKSTEGSGLIDIRTLADSLPRAAAPRSASSRADDVLGIGSAPIGPTLLAAPVPMLADPRRGRSIVAAAALASGGMVIAACVIAIGITRTHASAPAIVAAVGPEPSSEAPVAVPLAAAAPETRDTETVQPSEREAIAPESDVVTPARDQARSRSQRTRAAHIEREEIAASDGGVLAAREEPRVGHDREPTLDDLVDDVIGNRRPDPRAIGAPSETLPDTPSRTQVLIALDTVRPAVSACGGGEHGNAVVSITVAGPTGRVISASVTGTFAGTPVGTCIARAVRGAAFPRFARPTMTIQFPFRI